MACTRTWLREYDDLGDLPARPAPSTVLDIVFGMLWYRVLATRRPVDSELADELLAILAPDLGPGPPSDGRVGRV
ncbi:TetR/AcrR family transcriptional regulator C-terminal ligand-binding domain-containing protein [Streptomyces sp. NBC_00873]|uniref:TetR-like C-terminal domain-containing protein n=1 Tax=unclassified Streptomyces TaxID=2593676 RepID=UPI00386F0C9B|nr:TetR/AcrR family transcriptional regulator C-terminal ligand-binding domain-containing protein [Streptomyces sp. NBC_00873]WTA47309.1 TetR/AcrR family transcriptional regulator C-terminal ligand-binding domain-containing protein [Streptomyces sp. NBC_00842]